MKTMAPLWVLLCFYISAAEGQINVQNATVGKIVTLTCRAPSSKKITVVEWSRTDLGNFSVFMYRDGHPEPDMQHPSFVNRVDLQDSQMKDGDVSVTLKDVTINDAGTYECRVIQKRNKRRKRANLTTDPISIIYLSVAPPGPPGGTTEDGGKDNVVSRAYRGQITGISVMFLLVVVTSLIFNL